MYVLRFAIICFLSTLFVFPSYQITLSARLNCMKRIAFVAPNLICLLYFSQRERERERERERTRKQNEAEAKVMAQVLLATSTNSPQSAVFLATVKFC